MSWIAASCAYHEITEIGEMFSDGRTNASATGMNHCGVRSPHAEWRPHGRLQSGRPGLDNESNPGTGNPIVQICFVLFCIQTWFCVSFLLPKFLLPFLCSSNNCQFRTWTGQIHPRDAFMPPHPQTLRSAGGLLKACFSCRS